MLRFAAMIGLLASCGCTPKQTVTTSDNSPSSIVASVVAYESNAQWDHFDDGSFAAYDSLTLRLESPVNQENELLSVAVSPSDLPDDSPFRVPGTRITFTLDAPRTPDMHLAWGALNNPAVAQ